MTTIDIAGKRIDFALLGDEFTAASIPHNELGMYQTLLANTGEMGTAETDWPDEAVPIVAAHNPPPKASEYAVTQLVDAKTVTTDATPLAILTFPCDQKRIYRASLVISGVDRGNFVSLVQEGRFVWKRLLGNALAPGITVVSSIPTTPPTGWATNCVASGTNVIFTVQGAAGRTIDWLLIGEIGTYAPEGLA